MNKKLGLITVGFYLIVAGLLAITIFAFSDHPIRASIYPRKIYTNEPVFFKDSTTNSNSILWEFGNGDKTSAAHGQYIFKEAGSYLVRLTVNNKKQSFLIEVANPKKSIQVDSTVLIYAEKTGLVDQKIHFKAMGQGIEWCEWFFNESGRIESRASETFYSYNTPGTYEVTLITNLNFNKPQKHTIVIQNQYKITENTILKAPPKKAGKAKEEKKPEDVLKTVIQEIAYGNDFTKNYNTAVKMHLCSNQKTPVIINGTKTVDFYSYCQGLQLNANTVIKSVTIDMNTKTNCPLRILIQQ